MNEKLRLIIADSSGLTFVGYLDLDCDGDWLTVRDAMCVVKWGTSAHLAELACGPTSSTQLGRRRDVIVNKARVIAVYDCDEQAWKRSEVMRHLNGGAV